VLRSVDELKQEALAHYEARGWTAVEPGTDAETAFCLDLSLKPAVCLKRDGMLLLVYGSNSVGDTQHRLFKQVMFDLLLRNEFCHVLLVFDRSVNRDNEKLMSGIGVGLMQVRDGNDPVLVRPPKLSCFKGPLTADRIPQGIRPHVQSMLKRISEEDTATAVMDLVQVVEQQFDRLVPNKAGQPLGAKITECQQQGLLYPLVVEAAKRINNSRIVRAHPATHEERRKDVVQVCQTVVDDSLAILFAMPP